LPREFDTHSFGRKNPKLTFYHYHLHFLLLIILEVVSKSHLRPNGCVAGLR
jgi:hypothetical protein